MKSNYILFGDNLIYTSDIASLEEKNIEFKIITQKKNPEPKPTGFFGKLLYSETIDVINKESFFCLILKVKGEIQEIKENQDF